MQSHKFVRWALVFSVFILLFQTINIAHAAPIFQDTFTRPDSSTLGEADIGGTWIKANEMAVEYTGSSGEIHAPATISLANGELVFHYPQSLGYRPAMPYAFSPMKKKTQSASLSFVFNPSGGRVEHAVGLMDSSQGFVYPFPDTVSPDEHFRYQPTKGISIIFARSGAGYSNTQVLILKYEAGIVSRVTNELYLPFQFDQGTPVRMSLSIGNDTVAVTASNGSQNFATSVPLNGFKVLMDQVFVYDEQHGEGDLGFDNFIVDSGIVRQVGIDIIPGVFPNTISISGSGSVPFTILSDTNFDATQVNPQTINLAGGRVKMIGQGGGYACTNIDTNADGLLDLVCSIKVKKLDLQTGDDTAILEAKLYSGEKIRGEDSVKIIP